ncbi:MAG: hypothetical protein ACFE9T_13680 [Promethearchaeota archaeon]
MHYNCPNCSSMKKPKIVRYFPPITVRCSDCGYVNLERKFIKDEKIKLTPVHYSH